MLFTKMDEIEFLAVWYLSRKAKNCIREMWVHPVNKAVSYTHLDVYKRQSHTGITYVYLIPVSLV